MTYLVGVIVAAWFLAQIGPRLLGVDLAAECRDYEEKMSGGERVGRIPRIANVRHPNLSN